MSAAGPAGPVRSLSVRRRDVLVGALLIAGVIAGVVGLSEALRHPAADPGLIAPAAPEVDPRVDVTCPDPVPREGQERQPAALEPTAAVSVDSSDLHECPETFDRRIVTYRGEVVGAVLRRSQGAWVQLNDDVYADVAGPLPAHRDLRGGNAGVGVLVPHHVADQISTVGGPGVRGDVLTITGVFRRVDPRSREVAVIEALGGEVAEPGQALASPRLLDREIAAALLTVLAVGLIAWERVRARRLPRPR